MDVVILTTSILALSAFCFFFIKQPKNALAWLLALIPLYVVRLSLFGIPFTLLEGGIVVAATATAFLVATKKEPRVRFFEVIKKYKALLTISALLVAAACISTTYAVDLQRALGILKAYFIEPYLVLFLILFWFRNIHEVHKALKPQLIVVAVVSAIALIQWIFGVGFPEAYELERRATSIFPYPAALALYLTPLLVIFGSVWAHPFLSGKKKLKGLFFGSFNIMLISAFLLGLIALVLSQAEGGIGAVVVALGLLGFMHPRVRIFEIVLGVIAAIVIVLVPEIREYLVQVVTFSNVSGEVRLAVWEGTWNLLSVRPILGAGLASFPEVYAEYKLDRHVELLLYPHNVILNFWAELGLFGILSFVALIAYFFKESYKSIKQNASSIAIGLMLAMTAILIYGLVDVPYFKNDLAVQFLFIVGLLFVVSKGTK